MNIAVFGLGKLGSPEEKEFVMTWRTPVGIVAFGGVHLAILVLVAVKTGFGVANMFLALGAFVVAAVLVVGGAALTDHDSPRSRAFREWAAQDRSARNP